MNETDYRCPIIHRPPHYCTNAEEKLMVIHPSHKYKAKWDEEQVVAKVIANMKIFGRWFSTLMPNLYLESGLHSGVMVAISIPSKKLIPNMSFPGDVDILIIPYDGDDLILSKTVAVEAKVLRAQKRRPGKSPNKLGYSQAQAMLDIGFPYVAVGHLIVTDDIPEQPNREVLIATIGPRETIASLALAQIDMFENDLANRSFGRLSKNCPNDQIGYFAMNYDGNRIFEPLGRSCGYNANCTRQLLDCVKLYYEKNYSAFFELPRYSDEDISYWENRLKEQPKMATPWNLARKLLEGQRILTSSTCMVSIDGIHRIGHLYETENDSFLFYDLGSH